MNRLISLCAIVLMVPVLLAPVGCRPSETEVVEHIMIFEPEPGGPPTSGWALRPPNPHPEDIQRVFNPGEEMFLGLSLSSDILGEITFSKCTFLNQETGAEEPVSLADDLGPFEPGRSFLLGFEAPWPVPDTPGIYKIQIYLDDSVVASAVFEVSSETTPTPPPILFPPPLRTDWEEGSPPPEGLEGWGQPRSLTEDEKTSVIEIALNSPRASEWLQGGTDYRVGSVDWYAIIWNGNGEAGTWWSLEYNRVANEGVPDFVSPYALWYPGVTIAVGEGTIYQMQIAVDLDSGKTAMVMGPYPSLSSPDRFKNIPEPASVPAINREQAIETATRGLPPSIVARADISAEVHGWYWEVVFDNLNATADELMPYPLKPPPPEPTGQSTTDPYPGIWQSIIITVDAQTGDLKSTGARRAPRPEPYVSQEQAIQTARERVLRFPVDVSWIGGANMEAYLQGDTWVVLFWEEGSEDYRIKARVDAVTGEFTGGGVG